ncbi:hypothetical protein T484DRAFT_1797008 [Baffinella frigidus]|nr:hypothetical protein T484DRAFT_1797008 [Cryptophyta sp. CCMP2293]
MPLLIPSFPDDHASGGQGALPPQAAQPEADASPTGSGVSTNDVATSDLPAKKKNGAPCSSNVVTGDHPARQANRAPWAAYYEEVGVPLPRVPGGRSVVYPPPVHWGKQIESELAVKWGGASFPPVKERKDLQEQLATPHEFIPVHAVYDDTSTTKKGPPGGEFHDLTFESRFDSGNLARSVRTGKYEYNLVLRPDVGTGNCQWYLLPARPAPPLSSQPQKQVGGRTGGDQHSEEKNDSCGFRSRRGARTLDARTDRQAPGLFASGRYVPVNEPPSGAAAGC